jgi:hypothetical protein
MEEGTEKVSPPGETIFSEDSLRLPEPQKPDPLLSIEVDRMESGEEKSGWGHSFPFCPQKLRYNRDIDL